MPIHREYAAILIKYLPNKLMGYWKKKMNKSFKRSGMTNTISLQIPSTKAFRGFNFQINILRSRDNLKLVEAQRSFEKRKVIRLFGQHVQWPYCKEIVVIHSTALRIAFLKHDMNNWKCVDMETYKLLCWNETNSVWIPWYSLNFFLATCFQTLHQ